MDGLASSAEAARDIGASWLAPWDPLAGRGVPLPSACELPWQSGIPDWVQRVEGAADGQHRSF
jgi:hypothetical protein